MIIRLNKHRHCGGFLDLFSKKKTVTTNVSQSFADSGNITFNQSTNVGEAPVSITLNEPGGGGAAGFDLKSLLPVVGVGVIGLLAAALLSRKG